MAGTTDALRLKVTDAEYAQTLDQFDAKVREISDLLQDYENLKNDAKVRVFEDGMDSNTEKLVASVQENIKTVTKLQQDLTAQRAELQNQQDQIGLTVSHIGELLGTAVQTAVSAASAANAILN